MSYLVLYRKFRPSTFNEVVGQEHITTSLKNQIKNDSVSHAYLFTGTRGTGKTSVAKIFAKSVNCTNLNNGSACGVCDTCKALSDPSNLDILEIDAASNNRVDEIRELREKVKYPPVNGKYKVYIIDEVHMLTDSAFNALLKTLEEPPKHVVFILATTEVNKLPATILSRCVRFDFKLVSQQDLEGHLTNIFTQTKTKFEPEAVSLIARLGEGSVRDMLSIADMCMAYGNNVVTYNSVLSTVGAIDKGVVLSLSNQILKGDIANLLQQVNDIVVTGKSIVQLSKDLATTFRDLAVAKTCENFEDVLKYPKEFSKQLKEQSALVSIDAILKCLKTFSSLENDFRYTTNPRIIFEVNSLNLCDELKKPDQPKVMDAVANAAPEVVSANPTQISNDKTIFGKLMVELKKTNDVMLIALIGDNIKFEVKNNVLGLTCCSEQEYKTLVKQANLNILNNAIKNVDQTLSIEIYLNETKEDKSVEELLKEKFGKELNIKGE